MNHPRRGFQVLFETKWSHTAKQLLAFALLLLQRLA